MQTLNYSPIFGYRSHRLDYILEDFCNRYYDCHIYFLLKLLEVDLRKTITNKQIKLYDEDGDEYSLDSIEPGRYIENKIFKFLRGKYGNNANHEPNGHNTFPDYSINFAGYNIYFDSKAVLCKPIKNPTEDMPIYVPSYNNGGGNESEVVNNILDFYNDNWNNFYMSFIIYTYYDETGYIIDVKIVPMIYCLSIPSQNWELDKIRFNIKSRGTDGQVKNSNVTIGLPSFTCKSGMNTLDEQELLVAIATYNYIEKYKHG